eukprot:365240-Chlamydomonas_euryale.AAC.11
MHPQEKPIRSHREAHAPASPHDRTHASPAAAGNTAGSPAQARRDLLPMGPHAHTTARTPHPRRQEARRDLLPKRAALHVLGRNKQHLFTDDGVLRAGAWHAAAASGMGQGQKPGEARRDGPGGMGQ